VKVTAARRKVPAVVCVHAKDMKEPCRLATSRREATAGEIVAYYAKRWTIEPGFRDAKDLRFGMGVLRIADPQGRDRSLLPSALAVVLLTKLAAAGESSGLTGSLNPTHPRKGPTRYSVRVPCFMTSSPNMPAQRLRPLIEKHTDLKPKHLIQSNLRTRMKMTG